MKGLGKKSVVWEEIDESSAAQRIDNYLTKTLKGVPKSHIYRILRSGEVRVNSKRISVTYRLQLGDKVRIPPILHAQNRNLGSPKPKFSLPILYEDDALLVVDKPSGIAVHGGSGIVLGVIEQLRQTRPKAKFLELVHRLDRDTSGILLLAKKRSMLTTLHEILRDGKMKKVYFVMVHGLWSDASRHVRLPLTKYLTAEGERRVSVDQSGQVAHTLFHLKKKLGEYSLLEAELKTGRTHQIRVHLAHLGFPILGDDKYGDFALNKLVFKQGLRRMFLHASEISFPYSASGKDLYLHSTLPPDLSEFLNRLTNSETTQLLPHEA